MNEIASREKLNELHALLTTKLMERLKDDSKPLRASTISEVRKFLIDNNVTTNSGYQIAGLEKLSALPFGIEGGMHESN